MFSEDTGRGGVGVSRSTFEAAAFLLVFFTLGVASTSLIGLVDRDRKRLTSRESVSFTLSFWKRSAESDSANSVSTLMGLELAPRRLFGDARVKGLSS